MLNDAKVASACLYVRTCQRVRNRKNIATIRDFQVYIRVNLTISSVSDSRVLINGKLTLKSQTQLMEFKPRF